MSRLAFLYAVLLAGCAQTTSVHLASSSPSAFDGAVYGGREVIISPTPAGTDEFRVFHQGATGFVSVADVRSEAERRASNHCGRMGKTLKLLRETSSQPPHILGNFPRVELIFACVEQPAPVIASPPRTAPVKPATSTGTGFAVGNPYTIATAHHVIQGAQSISLSCGDKVETRATIVGVDQPNDLAVLRIENPSSNFLELAPERSLRVGQKVFTLGFPVPDVLGTSVKYTEGVVSSLSGLRDAASILQITVPVQPGNSGGPLIDEQGRVVGVVTSAAAVRSFLNLTGTLPQNINWAVRSEYLRLLLPNLEANNSRSTPGKSITERAQESVCLIRVTSAS